MLSSLQNEFKLLADAERALISQRFFKTGPGQYGEGDIFVGLTVPQMRLLAKKYHNLSLMDIEKLLRSKIHEVRFLALVILVNQFKKADEKIQEQIYNFYLKHTKHINNWDLVDTSAAYIVGPFLQNKDKTILTKLAHSKNLWERRIALLSTFHYIKQGEADETFRIAELLLADKHDLIHKAVGWMLREMGKRSSPALRKFLDKNAKDMPRTALRYAIEKFPERERLKYLRLK